MGRPIRIVVADDHLLFRQGLKSLLRSEAEVDVVAETERADELPALLDRVACDVLLLDLQMERNALSDIESLAARVPVVVLTASEVEADAVAAVRKGAVAVVFKRFAVDSLMSAIRAVSAGGVWLPASLQTSMAAELRRPAENALSPREEEVARCVARGLRNAEIAKELAITEETVKTHLNRVFRKLGVRDRMELALRVARPTGERS
ncbi:MAG TPA: response regulator transcription factor [Candidatus Binatia bacterium]|nr:response regulator transcription factor [Candidatus Binatia bacterium]